MALVEGQAELVHEGLRGAVATIQGNAELRAVLLHRGLRAEKKRGIVAGLWKEGLLARLLAMLAERDRMELLPSIAEEFEKAWNDSRGVTSAEAVSATPLSEGQAQALRDAIGSSVGRSVELKLRVDPSLLGGVRVSIGGRSYDGTVRTRLRDLRHRLAAGGA